MILCCHNSNTNEIGKCRKWSIYLIALFETILFGGVIFGFAQLSFVLKKEGIYSHLCHFQNATEDEKAKGCEAQDETYALIYTIGCSVYGIPSVFIGYALHYLGLGLNRICAGVLISTGFICMGLASQESPDFIHPGMCLLALGGNQLRLAGLQSADLFPNYRATALSIISGAYSASAGVFVFVQLASRNGITLQQSCWFLAGLAILIIPLTSVMPCDRIKEKTVETKREVIPLKESLLSVSLWTFFYWYWIQMTSVVLFVTYFNSWISHIATNSQQAGYYSTLFSVGQFLCPFVSPIAGFMIDLAIKKGKHGQNEFDGKVNELRSPFIPLCVVCILSLILYSTLFFEKSYMIYIGVICLVLARPSIVAVGITYVRIRYPMEHFNRLLGIIGTIVSFLTMLNYFQFKWSIYHYKAAQIFMISMIALTAIHPLHLLSRSYRVKIVKRYMKDLDTSA